MKNLLLLLCPLLFNITVCNAQSWLKHFGGSENISGYSVCTDNSGNVIVSGIFKGTVDFDPGEQEFNITSSEFVNYFICKLSPNGDFIWAKMLNTIEGIDIYRLWLNFVKTDKDDNVIITGSFIGKVDFDPGDDEYFLTTISENGSFYNDNIFICKLSGEGDFQWVKQIGDNQISSGYLHVSAFDIDAIGNLYLSGSFGGIVDLDPGTNTYNLTSTHNDGNADAFICKYNETGNLIWAKQLIAESTSVFTSSIKIAADNSVYVSGDFGSGKVNFDQGLSEFSITTQSEATFIMRLDNNGGFIWAKSFEGYSINGKSITSDAENNVYLAGSFFFTVDFDPNEGSSELTTIANTDIYIVKLNKDGIFVWANKMGGYRYEEGTTIGVDDLNFIYLAGAFSATVDFDPGIEQFNLTPVDASADADGSAIFISKYSSNGNFIWASQLDANFSLPWTGPLFVNKNGDVILTGYFNGELNFNSFGIISNFESLEGDDAFVYKIASENMTSLSSLFDKHFNAFIYPNPTSQSVNIELNNTYKILNVKVINTLGEVVINNIYYNTKLVNLDLTETSGISIIQIIKDSNYVVSFKVIKQ